MEEHLILEIKDLGNIVIKLEPAISPMTYSRLIKALPTRSSIIKYGQMLIMPVDLGPVGEGKRTVMKPLEVGYWVKNRSLVISLGNVNLGEPVSVIGYVVSGVELLNKVNGGAPVKMHAK